MNAVDAAQHCPPLPAAMTIATAQASAVSRLCAQPQPERADTFRIVSKSGLRSPDKALYRLARERPAARATWFMLLPAERRTGVPPSTVVLTCFWRRHRPEPRGPKSVHVTRNLYAANHLNRDAPSFARASTCAFVVALPSSLRARPSVSSCVPTRTWIRTLPQK